MALDFIERLFLDRFGKKAMKNYFLACAVICATLVFSQESDVENQKSNPIFYAEAIMGYAGGSAHGPTIGVEFNYQIKKNLLSLRYIYQTKYNFDYGVVGFLAFPIITKDLNLNELSVLYGGRTVNDGHSWSFSGGLSSNFAIYKVRGDVNNHKNSEFFLGFPFEINIKWFKKKKKRFRAYYGLIPVGKPTSFGRSLGFKLYGNIGKVSYVGLGFNYGFGWHKTY